MPKKQVQHKGRVTVSHSVPRSSICLALMAHGEPYEMFEEIARSLGDRIDCFCAVVNEDDHETALNIYKAFEQVRIPGRVHMLPWIDDPYSIGHGDYGANRTRMLELAREWDKDYVLWLDPDDPPVGTIPDELTEPLYIIEIDAAGITWGVEHLIRKDVEGHWAGLIHEYFVHEKDIKPVILEGVTLNRTGAGSSRDNRIEEKSIPLLLKILADDPTDTHAWYYLAQSYKDIGKKPEAVAAFAKRAAMGGWPQLIFWCMFQVAELTEDPDNYLLAWNFRPERQEPLHRLAAIYNKRGQFHVARHFARVAIATPPSNDAMFVERWVENYGCLGEWAVAQYQLGNLDEAIKAWEYCLAQEGVLPHHAEIFQHNLDEAKDPGSGKLSSGWQKAITQAGVGILANEKGTEGSICADEALFLTQLVASHDGPAKIAETGFGLGWSAWAMLEGNPEVTVTSFDLNEYESVGAAKAVLDEHFPGRHTLVEGDSRETVPNHPDLDDFDLVYIDGGHSYDVAMADLKNFAKPGRMVVFDDLVPDQAWAEGCVRAWREATGPLGFIDEMVVQGAEGHAWGVGQYRDAEAEAA